MRHQVSVFLVALLGAAAAQEIPWGKSEDHWAKQEEHGEKGTWSMSPTSYEPIKSSSSGVIPAYSGSPSMPTFTSSFPVGTSSSRSAPIGSSSYSIDESSSTPAVTSSAPFKSTPISSSIPIGSNAYPEVTPVVNSPYIKNYTSSYSITPPPYPQSGTSAYSKSTLIGTKSYSNSSTSSQYRSTPTYSRSDFKSTPIGTGYYSRNTAISYARSSTSSLSKSTMIDNGSYLSSKTESIPMGTGSSSYSKNYTVPLDTSTKTLMTYTTVTTCPITYTRGTATITTLTTSTVTITSCKDRCAPPKKPTKPLAPSTPDKPKTSSSGTDDKPGTHITVYPTTVTSILTRFRPTSTQVTEGPERRSYYSTWLTPTYSTTIYVTKITSSYTIHPKPPTSIFAPGSYPSSSMRSPEKPGPSSRGLLPPVPSRPAVSSPPSCPPLNCPACPPASIIYVPHYVTVTVGQMAGKPSPDASRHAPKSETPTHPPQKPTSEPTKPTPEPQKPATEPQKPSSRSPQSMGTGGTTHRPAQPTDKAEKSWNYGKSPANPHADWSRGYGRQ